VDPARSGLTYAEVGATAGELPPGYHHLRRSEVVGTGRAAFASVAEALLSWEIQRLAGLRVDASSDRVDVGVEVRLGVGIGPLRVVAPCRVIEVVAQERCRGFAYGTLPGHPEMGEERFLVRLDDAGRVHAEIVAFSRPARWFSRLGAPAARGAQELITRRYLRAYASAAR
jgi:uncharacterized protein (UPF0548 family)